MQALLQVPKKMWDFLYSVIALAKAVAESADFLEDYLEEYARDFGF